MLYWQLIYLVLLFGVVWFCWPVKEPQTRQWLFVFILVSKLAAGLAGTYIFYYIAKDGDVVTYHQKAAILTGIAETDPSRYFNMLVFDKFDSRPLRKELTIWYNPSYIIMLKMISLLNLVTNGYAWLNSLVFSVFSCFGQWVLWRSVSRKWPKLEWPFFFSFFLVPSVIFWSAGITKEALLLGGLGFILSFLIDVWEKRRPSVIKIIGLIACFYLLWQIRYFYIVLLVACFGTFWIFRLLSRRFTLATFRTRFLLFVLLLMVVGSAASLLHENFTVNRIIFLTLKSKSFIVKYSSSESLIDFNLEPTVSSFILNSPKALITTLYRPFIWESKTALQLVAGIENVFLMVVSALSVFHWRHRKESGVEHGLFWALGFYVFVMAIMLALNTPNFGSLLRYRTGVLPFFLLILLSGKWWRFYLGKFGENKLGRF